MSDCEENLNDQAEIERLNRELERKDAEIARLREEHEKEFTSAQAVLCADHAQTWYTARNELKPKSGCVFCDVNAELDRMRTALRGIAEGGCHAGRDGDCNWARCPQLADKEPETSGRHCPYDIWSGTGVDEEDSLEHALRNHARRALNQQPAHGL